MKNIEFTLRFVPAGTGPGVWDDPHAKNVIRRFMPRDRQHGPMIGIVHLAGLRPTPGILNELISVGEEVRAGRYGNFSFVVSSEDAATRNVIKDIASSKDVAIFVSDSPTNLLEAEPAGDLTAKERETMGLVLRAGGTVTAAELGEQLGIEQTTAGNRLVALHRKGYLQRLERPHPVGDLFIDPRSIRFGINRTR